jgi:hypothetical protein
MMIDAREAQILEGRGLERGENSVGRNSGIEGAIAHAIEQLAKLGSSHKWLVFVDFADPAH